MADEIVIDAYDPAWPVRFREEAGRVGAALPAGLLLRLEHVGSTAVPGMAAKPVIDMMGLVRSLSDAREHAPTALEGLGYAFWADNPDRTRLFFVRGLPPAPRRTHHLHLTENAAVLERHLLFRDRLRARPGTAAAYAALKRDLAARHAGDREAYTAAKAAFIDRVIKDAEVAR